MRNGPLNWLAIGTPKTPEHFFTSETGLTILGSKDKTQDIVRMFFGGTSLQASQMAMVVAVVALTLMREEMTS